MVMQRIGPPSGSSGSLDEMLSRAWQGDGDGHVERRWAIPIDLTQDGDDIVLRATVPGVAPEDINVTIEDGVLTINTETVNDGDAPFIIRERRAGKLYRALRPAEHPGRRQGGDGIQARRSHVDIPEGGVGQGATPGD